VPYAFHAQTVENDDVNDADADPVNEIQSISISGTELTLSDGGGTVTLPSSGSSLWSQNGSDIYVENNVGIGTSDPEHDLDLVNPSSSIRIRSTTPGTMFDFNGDAFMLLDKASTSNNANLNLQSEGTTQFYAGLLGNNNFSISTSLNSLNGLEVKSSGDVNISGELQTEATGDVNMAPIAYGTVISGTFDANSGNVSVSKNSTGNYSVSIDNESFLYRNYVVSLTMIADPGFIEASSVSGNLLVKTYNTSGASADADFYFVVYKP